MAISSLKTGKSEAQRSDDDTKIRVTVEDILKDIRPHGVPTDAYASF